jgi:hypothetical protein
MARTLSLPKFLAFKNISFPPALRPFMKPMLLASVGIHALVLLTPLPEPPPKVVAPKPKTVKVSALPTLKMPKQVIRRPIIRKSALAVIPPKGLVVRGLVKKIEAPALGEKSPRDVPAQKPSLTPEKLGSGGSDPMSDFPNFPSAIPGCLGLPSCFDTQKPLDEVTQFFEKQLPLKKFSLKPTVAEASRKVYQIEKQGVSQFLNVLLDGSSTVYVLAPNALTLADLKNAVQVPEDFTKSILGQLPTASGGNETSVTPDQLTTPGAFFTDLGGADAQGFETNPTANPEIDSLKLVAGQTPDQLFSSYFSSSLGQLDYKATPIAAGYGGGLLYEIKKGTAKPFYLNLVPTKSGTGTVVAVWLSNPS